MMPIPACLAAIRQVAWRQNLWPETGNLFFSYYYYLDFGRAALGEIIFPFAAARPVIKRAVQARFFFAFYPST
ncbi:MAG: hypothetical protein H6573_02250 [Lewinellaceae bacterium]|nr:hypothetical protein [Lewinellaceae bacterium]